MAVQSWRNTLSADLQTKADVNRELFGFMRMTFPRVEKVEGGWKLTIEAGEVQPGDWVVRDSEGVCHVCGDAEHEQLIAQLG